MGVQNDSQVEACVPAFLRNRGNGKTQAHIGRLVDYAALSNNRRVSDQIGALGRQRMLPATKRKIVQLPLL